MKLLATSTSPYARKVLLVAHQLGLIDQLPLIPTDMAGEALARENPLSKVPALVLDDGSSLFDSPVICEYLDSLHSGPKVFPPAGPARWQALREQALGDGLCDAAVFCLLESRRPPERQWPEAVVKQKRKLTQGLDQLERDKTGAPGEALTIGELAVLAALGYLDFRFPADDWRASRPRLSAWFARASDRDSFRATQPHA